MFRKPFTLSALCCGMFLSLGFFSSTVFPATHDVTVGNNFFSPNDLTIEVGDTVRWTNNANRTHDVTADDFSWASQTSSSFVFERTFNSIEEVLYHCTVHSAPGRSRNSNQNGIIRVTAAGMNEDPNSAFSSSCTGLDCDFTDQSTDSDGTIVSWLWEFGDDTNSTVQNPSHSYASAGTYTVKLTVTDDGGVADDESTILTVSAANQAPSASFSASCAGLGCNFTDQSTDSDGTISSWSWSFGDGSTSSMQNPGNTYAAAGTYTVTLTVTDDGGDSDSSSSTVTVEAPLPGLVLINAGMTDAWLDPATTGQGFFIIVWEGIKFIFLSWFTFDTERPPDDVTAIFGGPGQRWVTAQGPYDGDTATLDVFLSTEGVFDSEEPETVTDPEPYGTITIQWTSCTAGILTYNIPSLGLMGEIPISRIVDTNVALCEAGQDSG